MEAYAQVLTYAIPGFVILIIIESIVAKLMNLSVNSPMDTISSLSSGMTNTLKSLIGLSIVIVSYNYMESHIGLFDIQSTLWLYILTFIGLDFAGYWSHRFNHRINIMWNRHVIHHSSEEFNLSCALRQTISSFVGVYFFLYVPMALLGIPTKVIAIASPLHLFAQFWYHTRVINKMGFLEHIIVTPSHHRVHHAINDIYIDKNFSEIFIIWDKWFGTFQQELKEEPPVYGTLKQANTWNPILINFMHIWQLVKDAWRTNNLMDKFKIWFMPTGWRPADLIDKYPVSIVEDVHKRDKYATHDSFGMLTWSWFQLVVHNVLLYHLLKNIANLNVNLITIYVVFLSVSIFSYTSLMDRHPIAVPSEVLKTLIGFLILFYLGGWFGLENLFSVSTLIMGFYLAISMALTLYFSYFEKVKQTNLT
jgi:sterol desaturase/sphingolipid hydroxylase (fatty acid hydroxylase superfamily)